MEKTLILSGVLLVAALSASAAEIRVPAHHLTIQAAIDAARSGDVVLVAAGTYRERIVLKPGVTLRSLGDDAEGKHGLKRAEGTIIDGGGSANGSQSPGVTMAEGATLDGFVVTRVGLYDDERWQRSWEQQGNDQSHDHIGHFGVPALAVIGTTCRVVNNIVHHNGDIGIAIRGVEGKGCSPEIFNNTSYRNMGGGIGSMNGSTAKIEFNRCFENFFAGIGHDNAHPLVTNNNCHDNIRAGIGISEGACPTVRGNRCRRNRRAGIGIRTGANTRPVVEDNDCDENEMAGIGIEEEARPSIRNNRCRRNKLAGIGCDSAQPEIEGNLLEANSKAGIGISGHSKVRLVRNTCLNNRLVAVGVVQESEATLEGNSLSRKGGAPPMVNIGPKARAVLKDNTIRGGGVAGILVGGILEARENTLTGEDRGTGILIKHDAQAALERNRIAGYRHATRKLQATKSGK